MDWDELTTIPGLREGGQINLQRAVQRLPYYRRDSLRAARGVIVGTLLGAAIILAVWGVALRLCGR